MRNLILLTLSIFAVIGSSIAALATTYERDMVLAGYEHPLSSSDLPFRVDRAGTNVSLIGLQEEQQRQQLQLIQDAGLIWVRQTASWSLIEPQPNEYSWEDWDQLVQITHDYPDLQLLVTLDEMPDWATESGLTVDIDAFSEFVGLFAERYGQSLDVYEIWEFPNSAFGRQSAPLIADDYANILTSAYQAIHQYDASATVLFGSLYIDDTLPYIEYLQAIYDHEVPMDGISVALPLSTQAQSWLLAVRKQMIENGESTNAIWLMTLTAETPTNNELNDFASDMYALAEEKWAWLGGITLFDISTPIEANTTLPSNGIYSVTNRYSQFAGIWTINHGQADIGWVNDSQMTFTFRGSEIALLVNEGNYTGQLYVTIDGEPANALPQDSAGNAYLLLSSDSLESEQNLITVANGLTLNQHQVAIVTNELIPNEPDPRNHIIGYAVSNGDLAQPYNQQITIAWITTAIALLSVALFGGQFLLTKTLFIQTKVIQPPTQAQMLITTIASFILMLSMASVWQSNVPQFFRKETVSLPLSVITAGVIYLEPGLLLTVLATIMLFLFILIRLETGLQLVIFWAPFFLFPIELYRFAFPVAEVILWLTVIAFGFNGIYYWARSYKNQQINLPNVLNHIVLTDYLVLMWFILGVIALTTSQYSDLAVTEFRTIFFQPVIFYLLLRRLPADANRPIRFLMMLVLAGVAVSLIGLAQFLIGSSIITAEGGTPRLASVYGSPNNVALLLGRCIPFVFVALILLKDKSYRIVAASMFSMFVLTLLLSQSVGALFLGVPASLLTIIIIHYRRKAIVPITVAVILGIALVFMAFQLPRFANLLDFSSGTNFYRLRVWDSSITMILDNPITGIGLDQFLYKLRGTYLLPDAWQEPNLSHPHNIILDFWLRLGIAGCIWMIFTIIHLLRGFSQYYHTLNTAVDVRGSLVALSGIGMVINLVVHGLVDNSVFVMDLSYIFMLLLWLSVFTQNTSAIDEPRSKVL